MYIKDNITTVTISNAHISTQKDYKKLRRFHYVLEVLIRLFFPKNIQHVEISYESFLFTGITFNKKQAFDQIFYNNYSNQLNDTL